MKNVIHENIEGVVFVRPKQKNKAEQLISRSKISEIVSDMIDESATESKLKIMWDVAKIICKDILKEKWKFNGDLNSFTAPQLLSTFLKWVLIGTKNRNSEGTNTCKVESEMAVITQLIMQSVKTPRQASYESTNANCSTYQIIETPQSAGVGLCLYHATRSKKLIKFFSDLKLVLTMMQSSTSNKIFQTS